MIMLVHCFHNQIVNHQLHFHIAVMHNKTLNCVIHDQHHRQYQNTDDLKHGGLEYISAEMNRLGEGFNQHDDSDQSLQPQTAPALLVIQQRLDIQRHM
ncbi:hypothetical protein [Synechococcus sp. UW179A]|uniref:hypothetical protein n=1 Tax=Synechococcus sp. UW179A TaxID=2575510 RepID=UPI001483CC96|nr:hypothetical protein [Synechococcus sp. UW179A]